MIYGQIIFVTLLLILAFWRRDIFFYLICCPVLITTGLQWYDVFHNAAGLTMSLALVATGLYCMILAIVNLLKR